LSFDYSSASTDNYEGYSDSQLSEVHQLLFLNAPQA